MTRVLPPPSGRNTIQKWFSGVPVTDLFYTDLLCRILRDDSFVWPKLDAEAARHFYEAARHHGVHLLLAESLWQHGAVDRCPPTVRDRLTAALRSQLAAEEIAKQELRTVLAAFADAGIHLLLFKGAALAFTHYPDPVLRPRIDTDFLIASADRETATATLTRLGYDRPSLVSGDLIMYQAPYARTDRHGVRHVIDLHWKVSNPQVFALALPAEELMAATVSIPRLHETARAPSPLHSLALACVHRVAHHSNDDRLIWIYDIHLLAERLSEPEREEFVEFAVAKQLSAVCAQGLAVTERRFHGRAVGLLLAQLTAQRSQSREPSETYAHGTMRKLDVLFSDLNALEGWRPRLKLLREHLFPPRAYMREVYGVSSPALLPLLYVWRFARGAGPWCRRSG